MATKSKSESVEISLSDIIDAPDVIKVRKDLGDISDLTASVKKQGQLQSLLVRPSAKKKGKFELISGYRRRAALKKNKIQTAQCIVRTDLDDNAAAMAAAIAENSENNRLNMNPVEAAEALGNLRKEVIKGGTSEAKANKVVASKIGMTAEYVRTTLRILDAPKSIRKKVAAGDITKNTLVALQQLGSDEAREHVEKMISNGEVTTAPEVKAAAAEYVQAMKEAGKELAESGDGRRPATAGAASVWLSRKEAKQYHDELVISYAVAAGSLEDESVGTADEDAAVILMHKIAVTSFMQGLIKKDTIDTKAFKKFLEREVERVIAAFYQDEEEEEEYEEEEGEEAEGEEEYEEEEGEEEEE